MEDNILSPYIHYNIAALDETVGDKPSPWNSGELYIYPGYGLLRAEHEHLV